MSRATRAEIGERSTSVHSSTEAIFSPNGNEARFGLHLLEPAR
jgi:hypothetical protein